MSEDYSLAELEDIAKLNWEKMMPYVKRHLPISYLTFLIYVHSGLDAVEGFYNPWPPYMFLFFVISLSVIGFFRKNPVLILNFPVSLRENIKIVLVRIFGAVVFGGIAAFGLWFSTVREVYTPGPINLYSKTFGYFQAYFAIPMCIFCTVMILYAFPGYIKGRF